MPNSILSLLVVYGIFSLAIFVYDVNDDYAFTSQVWAWIILWPIFTTLYVLRNIYRIPFIIFKFMRELSYTSIEIIKDILKG